MFPQPAFGRVQASELLAAADACDLAADAASVQEERRAITAILAHREAISIGLMQAKMRRCSQTPHVTECLPLRDEGDDFGYVRMRLPQDVAFHLIQQKNFGLEALMSDEGQRDVLKMFPAGRVKTVSGKTTVGWVPGADRETSGSAGGSLSGASRDGSRSARSKVRFDVGTMEFAR